MANTDLFDAYFKRADLDGDGQISGAEAVAFFQGCGLPKQVLAQVWTYADQKKAGYLDRQEFYNALKLVTVAQSKRELTPDIVKAALYSPASAKIPAPQINLAATPASRLGAPSPQFAGTTSGAGSQNIGIRPPLAIGSVSTSQQFFPTPQNQHGRPPHAIPPGTVSHTQQVPVSQGMPKGIYTAPPRPSTSNTSTDWLGGSTGGPTSQIANRGISPPVTQDGFEMMASGFTPSVRPRPQTTTGQLPSTGPKPQDAVVVSNQPATKDSKQGGTVGNGPASDSLYGDVFAAGPLQPKQSSLSVTSSASSLPSSSPNVPLSTAPQPLAEPSPLDSLQSTFSQQTGGLPLTGRQNQQVASQGTAALPSTGLPVGAGNSVPNKSQLSWPRMTQSDIQKYVKVFVEVDTDRDGKITGLQARNLFLSWRLPREVLKLVWDLSDQDNDSMLSLREFCTALYLMERYREGRPLPTTLPSSVMADEALLSITSHRTPSNVGGTWGPASGVKHAHTMTGARPPSAAAAKPPKPPSVSHTDEKQTSQQKPKVPVLEKHLTDQLGQEEQDTLNSKFQEAARADKEVEELEKEISESRQKIEFFSAKMQELVLYKSRCDNRLNEVKARVSVERNEVEALAKKYEEKYKQTGDVASKLTIEEATFRDIQERKMELYRAIVKTEEGGTAADVLKEQVEHIQSGLEELAKTVNERCKQYGLRSKPTSLVELPFGWQPGIQEGAADWDEDWDKFEGEGFEFVKELTLDVQNVVAPPKTKSSTVQKETSSISGDDGASSSISQLKSEKVPSPGEPKPEKESAQYPRENGESRSPDSPAGRSATENHELSNTPFRESAEADGSPYAKEVRSDVGRAESVLSGDRSVDESRWGALDTYHDTESVWGLDGGRGIDHEGRESSVFGGGDFGLNPIRTGPSGSRSPLLFADSVPGTPAYDLGKSSFVFDSVPSTPAYDQQKGSALFDSVPSTPAYNQGKSTFMFADSVPSTPSYNFGNSLQRFSEGSEDHSFDSFSRFDSFSMHDSGSFQSSHPSLARFDSMHSTVDSDQNYGFPSRFDSFRESRDSEQSHVLSRFDSFRDSDQSHGFSRFDSFRDSDHGQGFPARFDSKHSTVGSDQNYGFPSRFDSYRESRDSEQSHGFSRFDSFRDSDQSHGFLRFDSFRDSDHGQGFLARSDSSRESRDSEHGYGFSRFDPFGARDSVFLQSPGNSLAGSDSAPGPTDPGKSHVFSSFDDTDPFGSGGPFRTSLESETPRKRF